MPCQSSSEETLRIGAYLAEFPPSWLRDSFSPNGWADIVEAVWAAEEQLKAPADGRDLRGGLLP